MTPYKVLCIAGARPNFVKIAPIMRALRARAHVTARLVNTGQHYDPNLADVFFSELEIPPADVSLGVGSASHAQQTAEVMRRFEPVLMAEQPQVVVVVGDVNSTLACAVVAAKFELATAFAWRGRQRRRPVLVHVEAGLRSFDDDMPEELNRKATDALADLLMTSEPSGDANLAREGVAPDRVVSVGNVMIDTLEAQRARAATSDVVERLGLTPGGYALLTLHRASNVDDADKLAELFEVLDELATELPMVFPVHPRTAARLDGLSLRNRRGDWRLIDPAGYRDFMRLMTAARLVCTDSGGVQEETTVLGVRCVTLRNNTERPATITDGTNILAGTDAAGVRLALRAALTTPVLVRRPSGWDGHAADRIADALDASFLPR